MKPTYAIVLLATTLISSVVASPGPSMGNVQRNERIITAAKKLAENYGAAPITRRQDGWNGGALPPLSPGEPVCIFFIISLGLIMGIEKGTGVDGM